MIIKLLDASEGSNYDDFVERHRAGMFFYTRAYQSLIAEQLNAESFCLVAYDNERMIGTFPLMLSRVGKFGRIANSLPFFNSNGGVLINCEGANYTEDFVSSKLIDAAMNLMIKKECSALTVVSNPLCASQAGLLELGFGFSHTDSRISLITALPQYDPDIENMLIKKFSEPRPRNIRKAKKSGVSIEKHTSHEALKFLYDVHADNMNAIGAPAKDRSFFENIPKHIDTDSFSVFVASIDGVKAAGLLLFYGSKTVEYFTPGTIHEFRNMQPSALLILHAMIDASMMGYQYWNWGGTSASQIGVYDFKKKWGSDESKYHFYTKVFNEGLLEVPPETLQSEYPNFYVRPY